MKKILIVFVILFMGVTSSFAKENNNYSINFNGDKYDLIYSTKNQEFGGYLNEYYKNGETYNIWSELVAVHHFPNAYSPIDQIVEFKHYLNSQNIPSTMRYDEKNNSAVIDFIVINNQNSLVVMEFNVFKYSKSDKCGSIALQYAKRYMVKNALDAEAVKKEFEKNRKKMIKKVKDFKTPAIITENIDKCAVTSLTKQDNEDKEISEENNSEKVQEITENSPNTDEKNSNEKEEVDVSNKTEFAETVSESKEEITDKKEEISEEINVQTDVTENAEVPKNTEVIDETEQKTEIKTEEKHAPVPIEEEKEVKAVEKKKAEKTIKEQKVKKKKVKKEKPYTIENSKNDFYPEARNYKEITAEHKKQAKEAKKIKKINAKKAAKERAKNAAKKLETD